MTVKIFAPVPVPFLPDNSIDYSAFQFNLEKWCQTRLDGIVLPGSNSEFAFLSADEKITLWRACIPYLKASGKILIAGTGAETTAETIRLTIKAAEIGAEAALVVPPYYYKTKMTPELLAAHYSDLADQASIPILIYNIPIYTGVEMGIELLRKLADHPNIVGIKDSSNNVIKMGQLLSSHPEFHVYAGSGGSLLPFLSIGAAGGISALANIMPEELRLLADAFLTGNLSKARRIQLALTDINAAVTANYGIPGLKYCMNRIGYKGGMCRKPFLELFPDQKKALDKIMKAASDLLPSGE